MLVEIKRPAFATPTIHAFRRRSRRPASGDLGHEGAGIVWTWVPVTSVKGAITIPLTRLNAGSKSLAQDESLHRHSGHAEKA